MLFDMYDGGYADEATVCHTDCCHTDGGHHTECAECSSIDPQRRQRLSGGKSRTELGRYKATAAVLRSPGSGTTKSTAAVKRTPGAYASTSAAKMVASTPLVKTVSTSTPTTLTTTTRSYKMPVPGAKTQVSSRPTNLNVQRMRAHKTHSDDEAEPSHKKKDKKDKKKKKDKKAGHEHAEAQYGVHDSETASPPRVTTGSQAHYDGKMHPKQHSTDTARVHTRGHYDDEDSASLLRSPILDLNVPKTRVGGKNSMRAAADTYATAAYKKPMRTAASQALAPRRDEDVPHLDLPSGNEGVRVIDFSALSQDSDYVREDNKYAYGDENGNEIVIETASYARTGTDEIHVDVDATVNGKKWHEHFTVDSYQYVVSKVLVDAAKKILANDLDVDQKERALSKIGTLMVHVYNVSSDEELVPIAVEWYEYVFRNFSHDDAERMTKASKARTAHALKHYHAQLKQAEKLAKRHYRFAITHRDPAGAESARLHLKELRAEDKRVHQEIAAVLAAGEEHHGAHHYHSAHRIKHMSARYVASYPKETQRTSARYPQAQRY